MKIWVKSTRNGSDCYSSYDGMDQDTVAALLAELGDTSIQYITEEEWKAATSQG